jgi:hypothetical protein
MSRVHKRRRDKMPIIGYTGRTPPARVSGTGRAQFTGELSVLRDARTT